LPVVGMKVLIRIQVILVDRAEVRTSAG